MCSLFDTHSHTFPPLHTILQGMIIACGQWREREGLVWNITRGRCLLDRWGRVAQLTLALEHYTTGGLYYMPTQTGHTHAHLTYTSHTRHSPPAHLCYDDGSYCLMAHTKASTCMNSLGTEEPGIQNCVCVWTNSKGHNTPVVDLRESLSKRTKHLPKVSGTSYHNLGSCGSQASGTKGLGHRFVHEDKSPAVSWY